MGGDFHLEVIPSSSMMIKGCANQLIIDANIHMQNKSVLNTLSSTYV